MEEFHYISPSSTLTVKGIEELLLSNKKIELAKDAVKAIEKCYNYLQNKLDKGNEVFYGINTGFGSLCNTVISNDQLAQLQENLVKSHACGVGEEVDESIVRLMILLKVQGLSYGHSGVALETVKRLIDFYNLRITPVVYQQGSLGASGDLAPLAHLSLALIGKGYVNFKGERRKAADVMDEINLPPVILQAKEGLALLNGTQFMSAHLVAGLMKANNINDWSDKVATISLEAFDGGKSPFIDAVHAVRNHKGQRETAKNIRTYLQGSELIEQLKTNVQDPYSFRCVPQVHGASKDTIEYVTKVVETEINSVTDNPTIFPDEDIIVSAGNFHGQPLALAADQLAIALAELGSISERRIYKLISGTRGLPPFLVSNPGINSGFMIAQYAAASVVSKNKQLCTPNSVDTIDSSNGQEDHVSMGANAVVKLNEVADNVEKVMAIELFSACQAIEFRRPLKTSPVLEQIISDFKKVVPFVEEDVIMHDEIHKAIDFIKIVGLD